MKKRMLYGIVGPTASGKTGVAIALAQSVDGEVVSCDSMQIYQGMDILSAKPTAQERAAAAHHMISLLPPSEKCTAARFRDMALPVLEDLFVRGKQPILCGGTGLYVDAITRPRSFALEGNEELLARLMGMERVKLHKWLREIDPQSAARLHENDVRRVVRALEIYLLTGRTMTEIAQEDAQRDAPFDARLFALDWPRDVLYARIDRRVDEMVATGMIEEVRALMQDSAMHPTALQALGYKEILAALRGEISLEEALARVKQGSRNYAKRQLTWFRRDARVQWIAAQGKSAAEIAEEIRRRAESAENA